MAAKNDSPGYLEKREAILRYLASHEHAADTVEGIATWWLSLQRYQDTFEEVEKILEGLVEEGVIVKAGLPGTKMIYTRTPITRTIYSDINNAA